jgi:hypothetical protein
VETAVLLHEDGSAVATPCIRAKASIQRAITPAAILSGRGPPEQNSQKRPSKNTREAARIRWITKECVLNTLAAAPQKVGLPLKLRMALSQH